MTQLKPVIRYEIYSHSCVNCTFCYRKTGYNCFIIRRLLVYKLSYKLYFKLYSLKYDIENDSYLLSFQI